MCKHHAIGNLDEGSNLIFVGSITEAKACRQSFRSYSSIYFLLISLLGPVEKKSKAMFPKLRKYVLVRKDEWQAFLETVITKVKGSK